MYPNQDENDQILSDVVDSLQILTHPAEPMQLRYCLEMTVESLTPVLVDLAYLTASMGVRLAVLFIGRGYVGYPLSYWFFEVVVLCEKWVITWLHKIVFQFPF